MSHASRFACAVAVVSCFAANADAAISIPSDGFVYSQEFDSLLSSGSGTWTQNSTISDWYATRTGTGTTIEASTGSAIAGNLYSYGSSGSSDRAIGSLGSGNAAAGSFAWGALFQNTTGAALKSVDLAYFGEQWRNSAAAAQTVTFFYKVNNSATPPTTADFNLASGSSGWTPATTLDFTSPITGGTAGLLNGNLAANRSSLSDTITFSTMVDPGKYLWIGWRDVDHSGTDHGLSIDDVSATFHTAAVPELSSFLVVGLGGTFAFGAVRLGKRFGLSLKM